MSLKSSQVQDQPDLENLAYEVGSGNRHRGYSLCPGKRVYAAGMGNIFNPIGIQMGWDFRGIFELRCTMMS